MHKYACPWRVAEFATITCAFLAIRIILRWRSLKNSRSRNAPYLPKERSSKGNSIVINLFPRSFISQVTSTLIIGEEVRGQQHTMIYLSLLRIHSIFPKTIYSPLRGLIFLPLPLLWPYINSSNLTAIWDTQFFPLWCLHADTDFRHVPQ